MSPAEQLAIWFHDAYEELAPSHGYETREASRKPWDEVPENNRALMVATAQRILDRMEEERHPVMMEVIEGLVSMSLGVARITLERHRQIREEGFTKARDDGYTEGQLADAGAAYAIHSNPSGCGTPDYPPSVWPWNKDWWKPGDGTIAGRMRELSKAGALIAAELDRLERIVKAEAEGP